MKIKYLISYGYLFGLSLIFSIILSVINYFVPLPAKIFKIIIPIISLFIASIILGKGMKEKGYIEGIKFSVIYLIFTTILKLIFHTGFNFKVFLMYIVFIFSSVIGSMIGINMKKDNN